MLINGKNIFCISASRCLTKLTILTHIININLSVYYCYSYMVLNNIFHNFTIISIIDVQVMEFLFDFKPIFMFVALSIESIRINFVVEFFIINSINGFENDINN